jgi:hypothetical protein
MREGRGVVSFTLWSLHLQEKSPPPIMFGCEAWWDSEPFRILWSREKSLSLVRNGTSAVQPVASHYTLREHHI